MNNILMRYEKNLFGIHTTTIGILTDLTGITLSDLYALTFSILEYNINNAIWLDYEDIITDMFSVNENEGRELIRLITDIIPTLRINLPKDIIELRYIGQYANGIYVEANIL